MAARSCTNLLLLILSLAPLFFQSAGTTLAAHHVINNSSSTLQLPVGLHFRISSFENESSVGMATVLDEKGIFFPILNSPSFNSSNPSVSRGFSLSPPTNPGSNLFSGYNLFLAVCAGLSGNYSNLVYVSSFNITIDGFVFSVWISNLNKPITSGLGKASLGVIADENYAILQLRNGNDTLWNVSGVAKMEMRDCGDLLIYINDSGDVVWQSFNMSPDVLLEGQKLAVGGELRISNDSKYLARMEKGGLVLYMYNAHFGNIHHPPYWILPIFNNSAAHGNASVDEVIATAPCRNSPAFTMLEHVVLDYGYTISELDPGSCSNVIQSSSYEVDYPGSIYDPGSYEPSWSLLWLEINGTLCSFIAPLDATVESLLEGFYDPSTINVYEASMPPDEAWEIADCVECSRIRKEIDFVEGSRIRKAWLERRRRLRRKVSGRGGVGRARQRGRGSLRKRQYSYIGPTSVPFVSVQAWGPECALPMACGPVGVCTPEGHSPVKTPCSCPDGSYFEPWNLTDSTQGCKRRSSLPNCITGREHINSTDFLELNYTASIFLFTGWNFSPFFAPVAYCKSICSSNCSCHGFHYHADIAACFYITSEFSLLKVPLNKTLTLSNYTLPTYSEFYGLPSNDQEREIIATRYVTYLKVVPLHLPSGADNTPGNNACTSGDTRATTALLVILPTFATCLVIGMTCMGFRVIRVRQRKLVQMRLQAEEERELQDILPLLPTRFSYKDLHEATEDFSKLLGAGGCGYVYLGVLQDGRKVAVKELQVVLQGAEQSRQFLAEVGSIGRTNHHNIVRLYGFCWEISHRLLVYEYVERGSLDQWLFVDDLKASLNWQTRYNLALGIGYGVHYLHEECEQPILHFDVKPQNILLGDDFVPKLADFGMSRLITQRDVSSIVTGVRGTPGYIAPEWFSHCKVSKKSDIFSMGMVFLELVGGRKILDYSLLNSSDSTEQEAWHLPSWAASKCEQGLMMEIVDKHLHVGGFDAEQLQRLIHVAFWCIHEDPAMRPSALTVLQWLQGISPKTFPPLSLVIGAAVRKPLATSSVYDGSHIIDHVSMYSDIAYA